ncbi:GPI-anchored cell surface glycoprotein [Rasamsonia emersonii CBS 393.64]|uniref:GPI-anchored cell surface glycoprotein n=1 Tax=Rasamsonia emersonii (strain ATCC 16479 / CBS 393.64 / IMI 116815) TaxID=1408163 RepID=A0A0F4YKA6_RASE3|nr:GPI-anchored cell surface glycoprotein [Rasamsonia emersonii CBS 393.64]KKA18639.1 GPI-anchored cell surface glycoprotein [Rasamsonia emersonii CBS 393.64]
MSLNGLDDPSVIDAYQTALAEAGGWFLLKYVSRDEVALHGRGTGGVPDVRSSVKAYEEKSPLYGFLQYRRRKVVLKYVPDGISRLMQARITVQFQSVLDKFTPQDTVFTFAAPSDLTRERLVLRLPPACGLWLMEIAEDAEEGGTTDTQDPSSSPSQTAEKRKSQLSEATAVPPRSPPKDVDDTAAVVDAFPSPPRNHADSHTDAASVHSLPQKHILDQLSHDTYEPRKSTQSMRPSLQDLDQALRPKVKLGPRPSVDINGRPRTAGSLSRSKEERPVAALPAGVRSTSSRKPQGGTSRPKSQPDGAAPTLASLRNAPPIPNLLIPPPTISIPKPQLSPGAKSMTAVPSSGMTPEKQRLMKALELRKKQMEKRTQELQRKQDQLQLAGEQATADISENKENIDHTQETKTQKNDDDHVDIETAHPEQSLSQSQPVAEIALDPDKDPKPPSPKPDSGVDVMVTDPDTTSHPTETSASTESKNPKDAQKEHSDGPIGQDDKDAHGGSSENADHSSKPSELPESAQQQQQQQQQGADIPEVSVESIPLPDSPPEGSRASSVAGEESTTGNTTKDAGERKKRPSLLEPIHVPGPDFSDEDNLLSDDSFMEELKSATVQEAKPVSVGKSSLSPNGESQTPLEAWKNSRSVSNPAAGGSDIQALPAGGRSVSASFTPQQAKPVPVLVAKKVNVSSGISKRIKALEMFSNSRETTSSSAPSLPAGSSTQSSSPFEKFRKRASISSGGPPPTIAGSKSTTHVTPSPSPEPSSKTGTVNSNDSHTRSKRNSVSVTARIVRDGNAPPTDANANPSEQAALNLQRSPLTVERESSDALSPPTASNTDQRSSSVSPGGSRRNSIALTLTRSESRSSSRSKADDLASPQEEKKESRTSRLMRRMSSLTSSPRRSVTSPPPKSHLKEEVRASPEKEEKQRPEPPKAVDIGEVNVQFPDTLLWKRRFLRIDNQGYLVLTPSNVDSSTRNIVKRYHLSEFKTPCLPDEDRQELPNSILLDFRDGSTLQCACESRQGQAAILQTLVEAHAAYQTIE